MVLFLCLKFNDSTNLFAVMNYVIILQAQQGKARKLVTKEADGFSLHPLPKNKSQFGALRLNKIMIEDFLTLICV